MWPSLVKIGKEEGWRGYFKGNGINVVRIAPYSAIQFSSYEIAKKLLSRFSSTGELTTPLRLGAGAIAGICSVVSTYPLDLVRSRLSIISASIGTRRPTRGGVEERGMGMIGMSMHVYKHEGGLRGLYRGLVPTVIGVAPYVGSNFAAYELLKTYFCPPVSGIAGARQQPSVLRKLACGALAGAFSQTITYPLDVLRRRMQVTGMASMGFQYNGAWDATLKILKKEGLAGLYKGLWPNFLKVRLPLFVCSLDPLGLPNPLILPFFFLSYTLPFRTLAAPQVAPSIGTSFVTYEIVRDYLLS
ncbi:hypothetical protein PtA15_2A825 [Puccinia triticina]|uniref:Mitochondrial carrier n=1 Tax=Puccinia triticina TaxID=208348 RepID=A0ABY7CBD3_9BASI|nr:uncharacterized protein PtA15_2A825 [Puccinia triticina]WAQ82508.1 hypothetical protein PtA15_2A825 [Puccinia triticina]